MPKFEIGVGALDNRHGFALYDAVVDAAGNGDFTDIQSAIDDGALSIFVLNGTYTASANIVFVDNLEVLGETKTGVVLNMASHQILMDANRSRIFNVTIRGTNTNGLIDSVAGSSGGDEQLIQDCIFLSTQGSEQVNFIRAGHQKGIISGCVFKSTTAGVPKIKVSGSLRILNNYFDSDGESVLYENIAGNNHVTGDNIFSNNYILNGTNPLILVNSTSTKLIMSGNVIITGAAVRVVDMDLAVSITISGNYMQQSSSSSVPLLDVGVDKTVILSNNFRRGSPTIRVTRKECNVSGNVLREPDGDGIIVSNTNNIIQGNIVRSGGGTGINITSGGGNIIFGNISLGNSTANLTVAGAGNEQSLNITS